MQPSLPQQPYDTSAIGVVPTKPVTQSQAGNQTGQPVPASLPNSNSNYQLQQQPLSQPQYQHGVALQQIGMPTLSTAHVMNQQFVNSVPRSLPPTSMAVSAAPSQPVAASNPTGNSAAPQNQSVLGAPQMTTPATSAPQGWSGAQPLSAVRTQQLQARPTSGSAYSVIPNAHELQKTPGGQAVLNALQSVNGPAMMSNAIPWMQPPQGFASTASEEPFGLTSQPSVAASQPPKKPRRPKKDPNDPNAPAPKRQRKTKKQQEQEGALAQAQAAQGATAAAPADTTPVALGAAIVQPKEGDEAQPMMGVQQDQGTQEQGGAQVGPSSAPNTAEPMEGTTGNAEPAKAAVAMAPLGTATVVGTAPAANLVGTYAAPVVASMLTGLDKPPMRAFNRSKSSALLTEEDKTLISDKALQKLVTKVGGPNSKLSSEVELVLSELVENFVSTALSFGASMAYQKQSDSIEAKDIAVHMERAWHIHIPGYPGSESKRTYRRPVTAEVHKKRQIAVRKEMAPLMDATPTEPDAAPPTTLLTAPEQPVAVAQE